MIPVYRAPMRSRRDDIEHAATLARALSLGLCGFGGVLHPAPTDLDAAVRLAAEQHDLKLARRIERFAEVELESFVWTRTVDGFCWLGRVAGPWRYDGDAAAVAVDLVHVRRCQWAEHPVAETDVPAAVIATYGRGGRNFQQTHDLANSGRVSELTERIWVQLGAD